MKKTIKMLILILMIIFLLSTVTYALTLDELKGGGAETGKIHEVGNKLVTYISVIGSIVSVIALVALGIKYMLGSVEEKAEYKKTLMPYVIGAVLVFSASSIAGIIYNMF